MTWKHDGHDVIMLKPEPPKPGAAFGPYCIDCKEAMLIMAVPGPDDMVKAKKWIDDHPEIMAHFPKSKSEAKRMSVQNNQPMNASWRTKNALIAAYESGIIRRRWMCYSDKTECHPDHERHYLHDSCRWYWDMWTVEQDVIETLYQSEIWL